MSLEPGRFAPLVLLFALGAAGPAAAQGVEAGKVLYQQADCAICHGWAGDGGEGRTDLNPKIASIRASKMDDLQVFDTIRCSKPFGEMPFYEAKGYTDERCYGFRAVDVPGVVPPLSHTWLNREQIGQMVAYLRAKVIGRPAPTFEDCVEYFGPGAASCDKYPKRAN